MHGSDDQTSLMKEGFSYFFTMENKTKNEVFRMRCSIFDGLVGLRMFSYGAGLF